MVLTCKKCGEKFKTSNVESYCGPCDEQAYLEWLDTQSDDSPTISERLNMDSPYNPQDDE